MDTFFTKIDFTSYYNKAEIDTLFSNLDLEIIFSKQTSVHYLQI